MLGYSLGSFLRLQIKLSAVLKPDHIRECVQQLEDGHQRPQHEEVAHAINFLQNTRAMCAGDAQYLSLLRDLLSGRSSEAVELIDEYIESQSDSRNEPLPFNVSRELNYWREEGYGDPQAYNSMLMRLYDRIGPRNLRIMVATSPLNEKRRDDVESVEQFLRMLGDMGVVGPDNLQLLIDWCMELRMEWSLLDLVEYWSSSGESKAYLSEQNRGELHGSRRLSDDRSQEPSAVFASSSTVIAPRAIKYADHGLSRPEYASNAAASSVRPMSILEGTVPRSQDIPHIPHWAQTFSESSTAQANAEIKEPTVVFGLSLTGPTPRAVRYADYGSSMPKCANNAAVSSVQEELSPTSHAGWQPMSRLEGTVPHSREIPHITHLPQTFKSSLVQPTDHQVSLPSLTSAHKEMEKSNIPTETTNYVTMLSGQGSPHLPAESAMTTTVEEVMTASSHSNTTSPIAKQLPGHHHRQAENRLYPSLEEFQKQDTVNNKTDLKGKKRHLISTEVSHPKRMKDRETHRNSDYQGNESSEDSDSSYIFESANESLDEHDDEGNESESTQAQAQQMKQTKKSALGASIDSKSRDNKNNKNHCSSEIEREEGSDYDGDEDANQHESNSDYEEETSSRDEDNQNDEHENPSDKSAASAINKTSRFRQLFGGIKSYLGWNKK